MPKPIDIRKLSDLEVLKVCKELWVWLYKNPDEQKHHWPGWRKYNTDLNDCPCCAKAGYTRGTPHCNKCLLKKQFQRGKMLVKSLPIFFCENYSSSPWHHYRLVTTVAWQKKWALKMVEIIDEAIAELKAKEKGNA